MNLVCSQDSIIYRAWKSRSKHSASIASPTAVFASREQVFYAAFEVPFVTRYTAMVVSQSFRKISAPCLLA